MPIGIGNTTPAPGFYQGTAPYGQNELLFSMAGYVPKGVTLKPGQGVLKAGTVLSFDQASGQYVKWTTGTANGILRHTVDTDALGAIWESNIVNAGSVKLGMVLDANSGKTADNIATALNGRADAVAGYFQF